MSFSYFKGHFVEATVLHLLYQFVVNCENFKKSTTTISNRLIRCIVLKDFFTGEKYPDRYDNAWLFWRCQIYRLVFISTTKVISPLLSLNHNYNKILKSDWLSADSTGSLQVTLNKSTAVFYGLLKYVRIFSLLSHVKLVFSFSESFSPATFFVTRILLWL